MEAFGRKLGWYEMVCYITLGWVLDAWCSILLYGWVGGPKKQAFSCYIILEWPLLEET